MSKNSRNSKYSYDYHQPEDYRFSLDSVFLAQKVAAMIEATIAPEKQKKLKIMDLCAGCGVIGMELVFHLPRLSTIDFIEVQDVYRPYFEKNVEMLKADPENLRFISRNYSELAADPDFQQQYDLIVCNPPYFFIGEGLLSPNEFKNRCRFFIDSDFEQLILSLWSVLKPDGKAFVLVRPGIHHGRDLFSEWKLFLQTKQLKATVEIFDEVRGTNIILMTKHL